MPTAPPSRIGNDDVRLRVDSSDGGFTVGVVVDARSHGSPAIFGLAWMKPKTEPVSWSADEVTHEAYFVAAGGLKIRWEGAESGEEVVKSNESFYFPPAHMYTIEPVGDEEVFLVWMLTPDQADATEPS